MRVSLLQIEIDSDSRSTTLRRASDGIVATGDHEPAPDLICLPGSLDGEDNPTVGMTDTFVETLASKAREMGLHVTFGYHEVHDNGSTESAVWCDADGDMLLKHQRITGDPASTSNGGGLCFRVAGTIFGRVGLLVGEDAWADPLIASMHTMGAGLIVAPCGIADFERRRAELCDLARRHGVWLAVANSLACGGCSAVIDPSGDLACSLDAGPGAVSLDIKWENSD